MTKQEILIVIDAENKKLVKELNSTKKELDKFQRSMEKVDKTTRAHSRSLSLLADHVAKIATIYATATGVTTAIKTFADFEHTRKGVEVATGATAEEMAILEEKARNLGGSTQYTASEVAQAMQELGRSGMSV